MRRFLLAVLLFIPCLAFGQKDKDVIYAPLIRYAANAYHFAKEYPQEKVYLHFDNTSYLPGDTIWFKAFVVNASDLRQSQSNVLYVDMLNAAGTVLKQEKYKIEDGQADGWITLSNANTSKGEDLKGETVLPSGYYEIRAYTAYMLNFQDAAVFSRVLPVIEKAGGKVPRNGIPEFISKRGYKFQARPVMGKNKELNVKFYPEGGHLLMGEPCRVAFKVTGTDGMGIDAQGLLNDTIPVSTVHDGMGSFIFTPTKKHNSVSFGKKSFDLPNAEKYGYAMNILLQTGDSILLKINSSVEEPDLQDSLGIVLMCRGQLLHFSTIPSNVYLQGINLDGVPEGVCQICLYDRTGNPVSTRMFYHRNISDVPEINVRHNKSHYNPYERIRLKVNLTYKGKPFRDRICLSVRDNNGLQAACTDNIRTDLLLSSDLRGLVWNPEYYFEADDKEHNTALDLLCLVQGWERYEWKKMSGVDQFHETHRLENNLTYNGWITSANGLAGVDDINLKACYMLPDSTVEQLKMVTGQGGYFGLDFPDFYGDLQLFMWTEDNPSKQSRKEGRSIVSLERLKPMPRQFQRWELKELMKKGKAKDDDVEQDTESDFPKVINADQGILLPDVDIVEKRMFIDYATFHDYNISNDKEGLNKAGLNSTLYQYFKGIGVQLPDCTNLVSIIGPLPGGFYVSCAFDLKVSWVKTVYLFDEPMSNELAWKVISLFDSYNRPEAYVNDSINEEEVREMFEKEKSVKYKWAQYHLCIVVIDADSFVEVSNQLKNIQNRDMKVKGFKRPAQFYSPQYPDGAVFGEVDNRRTLYWNPNVETDRKGHAEIEFYNNSYSTRFNVSGCGIAGGVPYVLDRDF